MQYLPLCRNGGGVAIRACLKAQLGALQLQRTRLAHEGVWVLHVLTFTKRSVGFKIKPQHSNADHAGL